MATRGTIPENVIINLWELEQQNSLMSPPSLYGQIMYEILKLSTQLKWKRPKKRSSKIVQYEHPKFLTRIWSKILEAFNTGYMLSTSLWEFLLIIFL